MATNGNRGRGRGGGPGGGGNRGGDPGNRRGSWRAGPPGSAGFNNAPRTGTPANGSVGGTPPTGPRQSINDHMNDMKRAQQDKAPKTFQTDTEISANNAANKPRELQKWQADPAIPGAEPSPTNGSNDNAAAGPNAKVNGKHAVDAETFGAAGGKWDQFETNSRLFGTQTSYQEELYTTKLNKSGADFKAREKEAEKLANEIMGQTSSNFHIQEERGDFNWADDVDEEEKYSGVVRNPNAYVPPGARRGGYAAAAGRSPAPPPAQAPKPNGQVPLNGSKTPLNGGAKTGTPAATKPPASGVNSANIKPVEAPKKAPSPGPTVAAPAAGAAAAEKPAEAPALASAAVPAAAAATSPNPAAASPNTLAAAIAEGSDPSQRASVVGAYRQFVDNEREKVVAKKQSIAKSEREKQLADLKKFQASFKVPLPIPKDILPILAKDAEKQKAIEAKAESSLQAAREAATKKTDIKSPDMGKKSKKIQMSIAVIPPFNPNKGKSPAVVPVPIPDSARANIVDAKSPEGKVPALPAGIAGTAAAAATATGQAKPAEGSLAAKLNPKASAFVFKPNANAPAFKPGQPSSPAVNIARLMSPAGPPIHPFFGEDLPTVHNDIRNEFNPFRAARGQLPMANTIPLEWPYGGRPVVVSYTPQGPPGSYMMPEDENAPYGRQPSMGSMGMPMQGMHPQMRYNQPPGMPQMNMQGNPMFSLNPNGPMPPGGNYAQMQGNMPMGGYPQQFMGPQGMYFNPNNPNGPNGNGIGNGNGNANGMGPGPNGQGHFMPHQQNGPPGHFAGPSSPTTRGMHHQQMQSMGGAPMYPFQGSHGPGPSGPGSASASSQGQGGPGGPASQIGTPMQTPQMPHSLPYPAQTPFQQPSPAPPSIPQMPHP